MELLHPNGYRLYQIVGSFEKEVVAVRLQLLLSDTPKKGYFTLWDIIKNHAHNLVGIAAMVAARAVDQSINSKAKRVASAERISTLASS